MGDKSKKSTDYWLHSMNDAERRLENLEKVFGRVRRPGKIEALRWELRKEIKTASNNIQKDIESKQKRIVEKKTGIKLPEGWRPTAEQQLVIRLWQGEGIHSVSEETHVPVRNLKKWHQELLAEVSIYASESNSPKPKEVLINHKGYKGIWQWYKSEAIGERALRELSLRHIRSVGYSVSYSAAPDEGRHMINEESYEFDNYKEAVSFCFQLAKKYAPPKIMTEIEKDLGESSQ